MVKICGSPLILTKDLKILLSAQNVRIVPRDPRTYNDWQVGDKVKILNDTLETVVEVGTRINNIVICFNSRGVWGTFTCEELHNRGKLILTDYEKTLYSRCVNFKEGDRVLVRDGDDREWEFGIFSRYEDGFYFVDQCEWKQCISYNERTWQLLGTTDDYKEENND